ncbi:MAG: metallophosphoesterase N-terminal domain-containing protein [Mangrovibacterium sp.]
MFNRRIFIRTSLFGGVGLLTSGLLSCKKDDTENEPVSPSKPEIDPKPGMDLYGLITDTEGNPLTGVVVSDGFTCVVTDEKGIYQMKRNEQASIVFYSTPSAYEINITGSSSNAAMFYSALSAATKRYDFTLKKLPQIETDFTLLCIGDPQVTSAADVERFRNETMPDLKAFLNASAKPCYGLVLGDVTGDHPELFAQMKTLMGSGKMTFFTTIGNHDKTGGDASTPRNAQAFCAVYGPLDYSFNRGNVHFICLDNVVYTDKDNYAGGF